MSDWKDWRVCWLEPEGYIQLDNEDVCKESLVEYIKALEVAYALYATAHTFVNVKELREKHL